jgi:hypothetical protein
VLQDLNSTDFAAKFASEIFTQTYNKIIKDIAKSVALTPMSLQNNLSDYASSMIKSYSEIKTIVSDQPSLLLDVYQEAHFRLGSEIYVEDDFVSRARQRGSVIIRGNAGAGKSLFLRRHLLRTLSEKERIPILFDLRGLNSNYSNLPLHIHEHAKQLMPWMDYGVFNALLKHGKIELLMDGLDEVSHSIRPSVNGAIGLLGRQFPKTRVMLTTRYGDRYGVPGQMSEFHICPFSKDQAVNLVRALDFPEEPRLRFALALQDGLYDKSPDLLSNPLLCSIMLLTYRRFAKVPDQLHLYYQQAYEVLFSRHDAAKEGFNREFLSNLDVYEMQGILDYFAAITYADDLFEFSESSCLEGLRNAIAVTHVNARAEDVKDDLIEAVSILNRDGVELTFVHRSFQEFFCAHYISRANSGLARACIDAVKLRDDTDSAISMAMSLNTDRFEEVWLLPTLEEDSKKYRDLFNSKKYYDIVSATLPKIRISGNLVVMELGTMPSSKNFGIYTKRFAPEDSVIEVDLSKKVELADSSNVAAFARSGMQHLPLPRAWREALGSGDIVIDAENRLLSVLSEIDIWQFCALEIVKRTEKWLRKLEARKADKEMSPMDNFRRAAAGAVGRVEGDLRGGKRTRPIGWIESSEH